MPSLTASESLSSVFPKDNMEKKKKKVKNNTSIETLEFNSSIDKKTKKEKKLKKTSTNSNYSEPEELEKMKKKEKKRKASEIDGDEEEEDKSETSSELGEPMNSKAVIGGDSVKKKRKLMEVIVEEEDAKHGGGEDENPNAVSKFRISAPLREALKLKGIESLFPIQAMTFDTILDGSDLVGRGRTGQVQIS